MREKRIIQTSIIGIIGNLLLVSMKMVVGLITGAISIISDGINNLTDALSSLITIIGTKLSTKPADKKHPYGHGRIEYITSLAIAVLVLVAGGTAIFEAIRNLIIGELFATYSELALILISIGIVIKIGLGIIFKINGKKYESDALSASGTDAIGDVALSTSTLIVAIICFFVDGAEKIHLENYLSILIGLFIVKAGIDILREAISNIIGKRADQHVINGMKTMICTFPEVQGAYDLILNNYGPNRIIGSVHIQVDDNLTAKDIHKITKEIQARAYSDFKVILTIGIYASNDSGIAMSIKNDLLNILKNHAEVVQMHGFYLDNESKVVSFDLILDFNITNHDYIIDEIKNDMKNLYPDFHFYVIEDLDISD